MNVSPRQSSRLGARVAAVAALTAAMLFPAVLGAPSVSAEPEKPRGAAHGYVLVTADGTAYPFGDAGLFGENQNQGPDISATGSTADGGGYWMVDEDGDIFAYGDATHYGSRADNTRNVVGLAPRPEGDGHPGQGALVRHPPHEEPFHRRRHQRGDGHADQGGAEDRHPVEEDPGGVHAGAADLAVGQVERAGSLVDEDEPHGEQPVGRSRQQAGDDVGGHQNRSVKPLICRQRRACPSARKTATEPVPRRSPGRYRTGFQ